MIKVTKNTAIKIKLPIIKMNYPKYEVSINKRINSIPLFKKDINVDFANSKDQ